MDDATRGGCSAFLKQSDAATDDVRDVCVGPDADFQKMQVAGHKSLRKEEEEDEDEHGDDGR